jgi:hypothetical protein
MDSILKFLDKTNSRFSLAKAPSLVIKPIPTSDLTLASLRLLRENIPSPDSNLPRAKHAKFAMASPYPSLFFGYTAVSLALFARDTILSYQNFKYVWLDFPPGILSIVRDVQTSNCNRFSPQ